MSDMSDYEDEQHAPPTGSHDPKRHAREQHNALERRRRDNIKDMYTSLREVVPDASGERVQASRAVILKKAIETIEKGQADGAALAVDVAEQEAKNARLREEIARLKAQKQQLKSDGSGTSDAPAPLPVTSGIDMSNFPISSLFNLHSSNQP